MKKLTNLIKNTEPKKLIAVAVATAVGTAYGVKAVTKKRGKGLANSNATKAVVEAVSNTIEAGSRVVSGIREDISTVVGSAKSQSCAKRCAHCAIKDTFKPCCKDASNCPPGLVITGATGAGKSYDEACKVKNLVEDGASVGFEATFSTQNPDELEYLLEPVKAEDVVAEQAEADALAEKLKNDVLKAEKRIAVAEAKAAAPKTPKAPRAPRTPKAKVTPTPVVDESALDSVAFGAIELDDLVSGKDKEEEK